MRSVRFLWIVVFMVPLGFFADRLCYIDVVDPSYHALLWMHERLAYVFAAVAIVSASVAFVRFVRVQAQLRALDTLRSDPPPEVREAFMDATSRVALRKFSLVYVDVSLVFCFTVFGNRIIISRGFAELVDAQELGLVALHELLHLQAADPLKALLWHLLFAALVVPGFEPLEDALYQRRERRVDLAAEISYSSRYADLLKRFGASMCASTPSAAFRSLQAASRKSVAYSLLPAALPLTLLALLAFSHLLFVQNLPYLQTHHC